MSSLTSQVLRSSFLLLLIRLIQRSLGLVSTLILARLLTPDDFGIVAIATLIVHFGNVLSEVGGQQYLIQKKNINEDDINSAWTLNIILKSFLWIALLSAIPAITTLYDRPELETVLYVSSLTLIIGAFNSPGLILLRRSLHYKPIFKISIFQKLISFSIVMLIVFIQPTYWALIVADIASVLTLVVGSYFIHPIRPKFCIRKIRKQWSFSQWILLKAGVGFTRAEADTILVSKFFTSEEFGVYHMSRYLSIIPSTDVIAPAIEPLMASFSRVKDDAQQLAYQLSLSMLVVSVLIIPISVFMWFFPEKIIDFFLGSQWTGAYPLLSALSILLFTYAISQIFTQCCMALGKVRSLFIYDFLSLFFIFSTLFLFVNESLYDFALLRGILGLIASTVLFIYISRISAISIRHILILITPVVIASLLAAYITMQIPFNGFGLSLVDLIIFLAVFGINYLICLGFFYLVLYKQTKEGLHLFNLTCDLATKLKNKITHVTTYISN